MFSQANQDKLICMQSPTSKKTTLEPISVFALVFTLVALVTIADYFTGYELRLAVLYLMPIAIATWLLGRGSGIFISIIATLCWFMSFDSPPVYSREIYYYWEAVVMLTVFIIIVILLSRLSSALKRADERFLHVLDELYAGAYVVDETSDRILYANRRLARMINADPKYIPAAEFEKHFVNSNARDTIKQNLETNQFVSEEMRDDASGAWYLIQRGRIPWKNNKIARLTVMTDISEQKQAQLLKRQHQEILHHTAHLTALAEIASTLAHEINQPLMAIATYNDACLRLLANEACDKNEITKAMEKCRAQTIRAGQIFSRMRDFIRRRRPSPGPCNLNVLVHETIQLLETELERASVKVDFSLEDDIPMIQLDRILIAQVIINLVQNAIDSMHSLDRTLRKITISTSVKSDGSVCVSVADRGEGISEDIAEKLFTAFFTTKTQGLGLGLAISKSVVETHGGQLWQTTNPSGGSIFHFELPRGS